MKIFLLLTLTATTLFAASYSEVKEFDRVEIVQDHCQIRQVTKTLKDGIEIASTFHRWAIEPEGDLSQFEKRVQNICKAAWTPDVIKKFKAQKAKNEAERKKRTGG